MYQMHVTFCSTWLWKWFQIGSFPFQQIRTWMANLKTYKQYHKLTTNVLSSADSAWLNGEKFSRETQQWTMNEIWLQMSPFDDASVLNKKKLPIDNALVYMQYSSLPCGEVPLAATINQESQIIVINKPST